EAGGADDGHRGRRVLGQHAHGVAEGPALVLHGGLVEDDLGGARRSPTARQVERVEPLVVDPGDAHRLVEAVRGGGGAVGVDDLGEALDRASGGVDAVDGPDVIQEAGVDPLPHVGEVPFDADGPLDHDV